MTESNVGYELAFASAKHAGIQFIELPQQWDEIETAPGTYASEFATMIEVASGKRHRTLCMKMQGNLLARQALA